MYFPTPVCWLWALHPAVIAQVFNALGGMLGHGVVAVIGFIIIAVIGHVFNFAINALGTFVHASRLQYVEFFGKFYTGGGVPFKPLKRIRNMSIS